MCMGEIVLLTASNKYENIVTSSCIPFKVRKKKIDR